MAGIVVLVTELLGRAKESFIVRLQGAQEIRKKRESCREKSIFTLL